MAVAQETVQVTVVVPASLDKALNEFCKKQGLIKKKAVQSAIAAWIEAQMAAI